MIQYRRVWFFLPLVVLFALDVALTLHGQPDSYWAGDRATACEANPIAHQLLIIDPRLFVGLALVWTVMLGAVIVGWTHRLSVVLAMVVAISHALGGASWLLRTGDWGVALAGGYLVLVSQFCFACWKKGAVR